MLHLFKLKNSLALVTRNNLRQIFVWFETFIFQLGTDELTLQCQTKSMAKILVRQCVQRWLWESKFLQLLLNYTQLRDWDNNNGMNNGIGEYDGGISTCVIFQGLTFDRWELFCNKNKIKKGLCFECGEWKIKLFLISSYIVYTLWYPTLEHHIIII